MLVSIVAALAVGGVALGVGARAERSTRAALAPLELEHVLLDPARALRGARQAEERGEVDRADALYAGVARRYAVIADYAALLRTRLLRDSDRGDEGVAAAADALATHPDTPLRADLYRILGDLHAARGDERAARAAWEAGLESTRSGERRAAFRASLAASFERSARLEAAAERWLEIWRHHPTSDEASRAAERLDALESFFGRTLRTPEDWRRRGDRLFAKRYNEQALAAYDTALAGGLSASQARRAQQQRAHTLFRLRRYPEAVAAFASLPPDPEVRLWHARSLARAGDVPRSVHELEALAEDTRGSISLRARFLAALLLDGRDQTERARRHFEAVATRGRGSGLAVASLWRLGWSDYRAGRFGAAVRWFDRLAGAETDPIAGLRARYWRARALERASDAAARGEFVAMAREYPLSYYGWRAAARVRAAGGRDGAPPVPSPTGEKGAAAVRASAIAPGRRRLRDEQLERPRILLAAGLVEEAREELDRSAAAARGLLDRLDLAALYSEAGDFHRAQRLVVDAYGETLARGPVPSHEELWWYAYPRAYAELVDAATRDGRAVPRELVWSIMREESGYRPEVLSVSGARGLLQIMAETGARLARDAGRPTFAPDDLFDPAVNIDLGAYYLARLQRRFDGRLEPAIASYNAGPAVVSEWVRAAPELPDDEWVEEIPYEQTRLYVKRVLRTLRAYRVLY